MLERRTSCGSQICLQAPLIRRKTDSKLRNQACSPKVEVEGGSGGLRAGHRPSTHLNLDVGTTFGELAAGGVVPRSRRARLLSFATLPTPTL